MFSQTDLDSILDAIFAAYASVVGTFADTLTGAQMRAYLPVGTLADVDAYTDADARTIVSVGEGVGIDVSAIVEAIWAPADWFMEQIGHPDAYSR
jgi:hypothetical protein